jgi:hypothetical protein
MQFYNKTSFRDARQDAHYVFFFLEWNQVFAFVKEPPECDSLICCCIRYRKDSEAILSLTGNEDLRLFPREAAGIFEFRFVFQHE